MADKAVKKILRMQGPDWQKLRKRFRVRPQGPVTALNVSGGVLRIAQVSSRLGGVVVTRVAAEPLGLPPEAESSDPAAYGAAIARTLARLGLKGGPVVMGVPRGSVVLRALTLPAVTDLREMASLVHFQMGRDLPFPVADAVIDFKVRREIPPGESLAVPADAAAPSGEASSAGDGAMVEVMAAAVRREVIDFHLAAAAAAGLKLVALGLIPYANVRCVEACNMADSASALGLVLLRANEVSIDVIARQALLFSRDVLIHHDEEPASARSDGAPAPVGLESAGQTDETTLPAETPEAEPRPTPVERVTIEVLRSLAGFGGMEAVNAVDRIVVAGDSGLEEALVDSLQTRLKSSVHRLDPGRALSLPLAMQPAASGAISALGLAFGATDKSGLPFDFLHPKRPAVQRDMKRIRTLMGAAAAAAAIVFLLAVRTHLLRGKETILSQVNSDLRKEEKLRLTYRLMARQAATLRQWSGEARNWLDHYAYLSAVLPPSEEIYLSSFSVNSQGTITLAVQARNGAILAKLDKELRAAGYDVKPLAVTPGADRHGYDFKSTVEISIPADFKMDLAKVRPPARPADDISLEGGASGRKGGGS
jgi:Tfp pilus assembly PilM family ATPase